MVDCLASKNKEMISSSDQDQHPSLVRHLRGHYNELCDLAFHPTNGKKIATCGADKYLLWWTLDDSVKCYKAEGHKDKINCCAYSPNGQFIATASNDDTVRIWVPTILGKCTFFKGHSAPVQSVSISPSNTELITGSNDKSIKTWNLQRREFICSLMGHTNWVRSVKYTSCGRIAVSCADDRSLHVWDIKNGMSVHTFQFLDVNGTYVSVHPNDVSVAVAMNNGSVRIYDIRNHKMQQQYIDIHQETNCVDWHPSGLYLLSCGIEGSSKIIDVMEGRPLYTIRGHNGSINRAKFKPDGEYFATGGNDRILMVWKTGILIN